MPQATSIRLGGVIDGLGNPQTFFAVGQPFAEGAHLSATPGQDVTRRHRGQPRQAKALPPQRPVKGHQVLPQQVDGLRIVPQTKINSAQEEARHDLERRIPQGAGQGEGALAHLDGAWRVTGSTKTFGHVGRHPAQPVLVAEGLGEPLRLVQTREDAAMLELRHERIPQTKTEINGLLVALTTLGEMLQGH